ncbi:hypothetical protein IV203_010055 [Nitzschia inconspicua]|uniref:Uncharacterized protein n=1 Tax=Nitzschia inconspicua TaxID=303405 RepID=A0A9K3PKG9_9STRA|nr:hypothetical protein IV203_010055 [Nitzschia inconspicua]
MNAHSSMQRRTFETPHATWPSPFHPEATAVPDLGDVRSTEDDVVTTIELTDLCAMTMDQDGDNRRVDSKGNRNNVSGKHDTAAATVAVIPPEDVLPMAQQQKVGEHAVEFFVIIAERSYGAMLRWWDFFASFWSCKQDWRSSSDKLCKLRFSFAVQHLDPSFSNILAADILHCLCGHLPKHV